MIDLINCFFYFHHKIATSPFATVIKNKKSCICKCYMLQIRPRRDQNVERCRRQDRSETWGRLDTISRPRRRD